MAVLCRQVLKWRLYLSSLCDFCRRYCHPYDLSGFEHELHNANDEGWIKDHRRFLNIFKKMLMTLPPVFRLFTGQAGIMIVILRGKITWGVNYWSSWPQGKNMILKWRNCIMVNLVVLSNFLEKILRNIFLHKLLLLLMIRTFSLVSF